MPRHNIIQAQGQPIAIANRGHGARIQFMDWMKRTQPDLYRQVMARVMTGLPSTRSAYPAMNSLGQLKPNGKVAAMAEPSMWEKITGAITNIGTAYAGYQVQSEMMDINLERARAGLDPLDAASMAPVVRTQVDLTPEMADQLRSGLTSGVTNMALIAAAALAAFFLFSK